MDIAVCVPPPAPGERCEGWCPSTLRWEYLVPMGDTTRRLCHPCATEAHARGEASACRSFDPGDTLKAIGGRRCINCGARESSHQ